MHIMIACAKQVNCFLTERIEIMRHHRSECYFMTCDVCANLFTVLHDLVPEGSHEFLADDESKPAGSRPDYYFACPDCVESYRSDWVKNGDAPDGVDCPDDDLEEYILSECTM